jgi:quercetin dioxygenase-like cupin family protein
MDLEAIKQNIVVNVYHIDADEDVPLHKHPKHDELLYCIKGAGFGVLEDREVDLSVGEVFIVPAGTKHSIRTDEDIFIT